MAKQTVGLGAAPNDGNGDTLRVGGDKINDNFDELYTALGNGSALDIAAAVAATAAVTANTAKVTNATHTGDVTGATALTIASDAVTYAKMQNVSAADRLLGRGAGAGAGDPQEITLGTNLSMSGTTLNAAGGSADFSTVSALSGDWRGTGAETLIQATTALEAAASAGVSDGDKGDITVSGTGATWTVDNDVVTNAKLANVATATIKGRVTAETGDPEDLTTTQVRTLLNVADGANAYSHPNHSGDVTSVGDGATTIAASAVTFAKMQNGTTMSVLGRSTNSTGVMALMSAGTDGHVLRRSGTALDFGTLAAGAFAANTAPLTTLANPAANTVLANATASTAAVTAVAVGTNTVVGRVAGNIVAAQLATGQVANDAVTNAKLANMAANTLKVNATGSSADPADLAIAASRIVGRGPTGNIVGLTAGSGITISDTQISATGSGALNNYAATVRPVVGDDTADGYSVGSKWIIVSGANADEVWICLDASAGAADWQQVAVGVAVSATKAVPILADAFPLFDSADGDATKTTTLQGIIGNEPIGTGLGTTGTIELNLTTLAGTEQRITLTGNPTFTTAGRLAGKVMKLRLAAGASTRTLAWPAGWVPAGAALPLSLAANKVLWVTIKCAGTADTDIDAVAVAQP